MKKATSHGMGFGRPEESPTNLIEDLIVDGDHVIIHRQEHASDGQIAAVRDEKGEVAIKRIFKTKNLMRLEPANKTMKPIDRDNVDIISPTGESVGHGGCDGSRAGLR